MMEFLSIRWLWLYAGVLLMLAELLTPGFVIFFFGLAAATVGALLFVLPSSFTISLTGQLLIFTLLSVIYLLTLRRYAKGIFLGDTADEHALASEYVGRVGKVVEVIRPEVPGRILLGDAEWAAAATVRLEVGTEVRVTNQNNLTLTVEKLAD